MKRFFKTLLLASAVSVLAAVPAHAAWEQSKDGDDWYYSYGDKYFTDGWAWIDANGDGDAQCFYFDAAGRLVTDSKTPDGSLVDADGCWYEEDGKGGRLINVMSYDRWIREGYTDRAATFGYFSENPNYDTLAALGDMEYFLNLESEPAARLNKATSNKECKKIVEEELKVCEQYIHNIASIYPAYDKITESTGATLILADLPEADSADFKDALNSFVSYLNDDYDLITAFVDSYLENADELAVQLKAAYEQEQAEKESKAAEEAKTEAKTGAAKK